MAQSEFEIERVKVRSDDGNYENTLVVIQEMIEARTRANPNGMTPGMKRIETVDGYHCNYKSDGVYEIVNDPRAIHLVVRRVPSPVSR